MEKNVPSGAQPPANLGPHEGRHRDLSGVGGEGTSDRMITVIESEEKNDHRYD
jgi:hypothetical protein